jgi:hypothetical protein
VKDRDVRAATMLLEIDGEDSDYEMEDGWDWIADVLE